MPDQVPACPHGTRLGIRDYLGVGQFEQAVIVAQKLICFHGRERFCMQQEVLFHLIADGCRQHQPAHPSRAKGQNRLVESPLGHDSTRENVGIQKQPETCAPFHFFRCDRRDADFAVFAR